MSPFATKTYPLLALALLVSGCGSSGESGSSAEFSRVAHSWRYETDNAEKVLNLKADKTYTAWLHELGTNHVELEVGTYYLVATGSDYAGSPPMLSYEAKQRSCDDHDGDIGEYELDRAGSWFTFRLGPGATEYEANAAAQIPPSDATVGCLVSDGPIRGCNSNGCRLEFVPHAVVELRP